MAAAQSWLRSAIGRTIAGPDIGMAAHITSGSLVTGHGGTVSMSGSAAITSCGDTKRLLLLRYSDVGRLPGCDESTQQTERRADERFQKIVAL